MEAFQLETLPSRVLFGVKLDHVLDAEIRRLGCARPLIVATPQQESWAKAIADRLNGFAVRVFAEAAMHTPVEVTERALALVGEAGSDLVVSVGGGSAIGLGKAIALRTDLPQIAVPTTYAGSEATPIIGETAEGRKITQRSSRVLPEVIIYDVGLSSTLPVAMSVTSGANAIAHAAEALYAADRNPMIEMLAVDGIRSLGRSLAGICADPADQVARSDALYGAWACGVCLGATQMGLHHKLCHTLGGGYDLPHSELHCVLLPYSLAYNAPSAPAAMRMIADALGVDEAATGLWRLLRSLGAPRSLEAIGMPFEAIEWACSAALEQQYPNPTPLTPGGLRMLLGRAFAGSPPK